MNEIMKAKIETCLELTVGATPQKRADKFRADVLKVTGITSIRFRDLELTHLTYSRLAAGHPSVEILRTMYV